MKPPSRTLRALCVALLLLAVAGCSTLRLAYNQADFLLAYVANDYFDLDTRQRQEFSARVDGLLKWHRQEALPDYVRFLGEIKNRAEHRVTREDALWIIGGVRARYRAITVKGTPDAVDLLATLTPENIAALEKQFAKVNQKFMREYQLGGNREQQRHARTERTLKRIRDWSGPLTKAQEERIAELYERVPYTEALRHQDRQRRQQEFLALLKQRHNQAQFARSLNAWLADWEKGRPPEVAAALKDSYEKRMMFYLEVEQLLTREQRAHVLHRIQNYIDDLNALAARRVASQ
ncbi:MAG: hypothetical protein FJY56_12820 [Betaproteobacteria bacterium]|nr:hypothetical protein [Betaproteobacteria bacterium]